MPVDEQFPTPKPSFPHPVPIITQDPDVDANYQVCFNRAWLPYVLGALRQLELTATWDTDNLDTLRTMQGKAALLRGLFVDSCIPDTPIPDAGCIVFPLSSVFVHFYPKNPYLEPGVTPSGWSGPPFSFAGPGDILLGYQTGDILVTGFPNPDSGDLTLPSIRFDLVGAGTIEIHMLLVPNGGMAVVTLDDDLVNAKTFDLNADEVSLPAETVALELVYEVNIATSGNHSVEVRFAPVLDDTLIPIRFGGGIRKASLCGFDEMSIDVRQSPTDCNKLQKTIDGVTWVDFADISSCIKSGSTVNNIKLWRVSGGVTQYSYDTVNYYNYTDAQGPELGMPAAGTGVPSGADARCIRAKNNVAYILSTWTELEKQVNVGVSVTNLVIAILGVLSIVATGGLSAPIVVAGLANAMISAGSNFVSGLLTSTVIDTLTCDLYNAFSSDGGLTSANYQTFLAAIYAHGGIVWQSLLYTWFKTLGPVGMVLAGDSAKGGVTECGQTPCSTDWYTEFNFLVSPYPAHLARMRWQRDDATGLNTDRTIDGNSAIWVSGKGWKSMVVNFHAPSATGVFMTMAQVMVDLPAGLLIKRVELDVDWSPTSGYNGLQFMQIIRTGNVVPSGSPGWSVNTGSYPAGQRTIVGSNGTGFTTQAGDQMMINMQLDPGYSSQHTDQGYGYFRKLRLYNTP